MSVEAKLDVRVASDLKERIAFAASLEGSKLSQFVRDAVLRRADEVIAEHMTFTSVPAIFFDNMLDALDPPNDAMRRAAHRADSKLAQI